MDNAEEFWITASGITRLDGARGKKQVRRPCVRTWGLPEANVLYWSMYVWHCWDFLAPPQYFSALRVIRRPGNCAPFCYAPADWTIMQRVKSYRRLRQQTACRYVAKIHQTCSFSSRNYDLCNYAFVQILTSYTWTTQRSIELLLGA